MSVEDKLNDCLTNMVENMEVGSPEELAWKLLLDDELDKNECGVITDDDSLDENNTQTEKITYVFEVLLTIYLELLILNAKIYYFEENNDLENFKLNFDNFSSDILINPYRKKIIKIGFFLSVLPMEEITNDHYCKILISDIPEHKNFFTMHPNITKKYHFVTNLKYMNGNITVNNLKKVYGIFTKDGISYKISFERI